LWILARYDEMMCLLRFELKQKFHNKLIQFVYFDELGTFTREIIISDTTGVKTKMSFPNGLI